MSSSTDVIPFSLSLRVHKIASLGSNKIPQERPQQVYLFAGQEIINEGPSGMKLLKFVLQLVH
jgi:hypothetical protein